MSHAASGVDTRHSTVRAHVFISGISKPLTDTIRTLGLSCNSSNMVVLFRSWLLFYQPCAKGGRIVAGEQKGGQAQ